MADAASPEGTEAIARRTAVTHTAAIHRVLLTSSVRVDGAGVQTIQREHPDPEGVPVHVRRPPRIGTATVKQGRHP